MRPTWREIEHRAIYEPNPFRPGDSVRCLSNKGREYVLTEGKKYKIIKVNENLVTVWCDEDRELSGQYWSRFELTTPKEIPEFKVKQVEI